MKAWEQYLNEKRLYLYGADILYDLAEAFKAGAKAKEDRIKWLEEQLEGYKVEVNALDEQIKALRCCGACQWCVDDYEIGLYCGNPDSLPNQEGENAPVITTDVCPKFEPRGKL